MDHSALDSRKAKARAWFEALRDDICAALEGLEDALAGECPVSPTAGLAALSARPGSAPIMAERPAAAA